MTIDEALRSQGDVDLSSIDDVLEIVDLSLGTAISLSQSLSAANTLLTHDLFVSTMKLDRAMEVLEELVDVPYDEDLDHGTAELMEGLIGSGAAEPNAAGELAFDERVLISKSDLKPILREAIQRWVLLKLR